MCTIQGIIKGGRAGQGVLQHVQSGASTLDSDQPSINFKPLHPCCPLIFGNLVTPLAYLTNGSLLMSIFQGTSMFHGFIHFDLLPKKVIWVKIWKSLDTQKYCNMWVLPMLCFCAFFSRTIQMLQSSTFNAPYMSELDPDFILKSEGAKILEIQLKMCYAGGGGGWQVSGLDLPARGCDISIMTTVLVIRSTVLVIRSFINFIFVLDSFLFLNIFTHTGIPEILKQNKITTVKGLY